MECTEFLCFAGRHRRLQGSPSQGRFRSYVSLPRTAHGKNKWFKHEYSTKRVIFFGVFLCDRFHSYLSTKYMTCSLSSLSDFVRTCFMLTNPMAILIFSLMKQNPEALYRALSCKLIIGMPYKVIGPLLPYRSHASCLCLQVSCKTAKNDTQIVLVAGFSNGRYHIPEEATTCGGQGCSNF